MSRGLVWVLVLACGGLLGQRSACAEESVSTETGTAASSEATPEMQEHEAAQAMADMEETLPEPKRLSMEFQDARLKDVLKAFSQQTGINVIARAEIGDEPITLYFEDVAPMDALDQILKAGGLTYHRPEASDIYIVEKLPEQPAAAATRITRVYRLKYARVSESVLARAAAIFGARTPFEASLETKGPSLSGSGASTVGGGSTGGGGGGSGGAGGGSQQNKPGIDQIIKALLTEQGEVVVDGRTNSIVITDVPENFPRLEAALAALDVRTPQIMVDAEIIETTLTKLKDLGIEWGVGDEGDIFSITPATRTTRFPFGWPIREWFDKDLGLTGSTDSVVSTGKIQFGTFSSTQSALGVLQALENDTDTKILARPKVLTLDNESAVIRLSSDEAIGFQTTSQAQGTQTQSTPERTTTGVVLVVTPQINDSGFITMLVEPTVTKTVKANVKAPSGSSDPRDPKTRSTRTLVRIRDGDTLVVGGLIDRSTQETLRKVPIMSDIPFLGEAFKNTEISNTSSELIVFVTPRILDEPSSKVASAATQTPMGLREQEPSGSRQDTIEDTLNTLEQPQL